MEFQQVKDSIFLKNCSQFINCDDSPKYSYRIKKDSLLSKGTKIIFLEGKKHNLNNHKVHDMTIILLEKKNGRKSINDNYKTDENEKLRFQTIYPKSELINLDQISNISSLEFNKILNEIMEEFKLSKRKVIKEIINLENDIISEKFKDLVIAAGYTPIGAQSETLFEQKLK
ncbi:hypothetical protein GCM10022397_07540 [Flavivirga jejuensis]